MILKILQGSKASYTPVEYPRKTEQYVNPEAAEKIGVKIPKELLESAHII
jgi:putative tryptophan/tyrosine transport system substrate-binding protein